MKKISTPNEHVLCEVPKGFRTERRGQIATDLTGAETTKLAVVYGNTAYPPGTYLYVPTSAVASSPTVIVGDQQLKKVLVQQVLASEVDEPCCEEENCIHNRVVEDVRPVGFSS